MIAKDLDRKYFFKQISKEMGFTALKTGIATLNCPYTNDYINKNFNLNMLTPKENKIGVYNTYMKNLIISNTGNNYVYRNLGLTYISPDIESINRIKKVLDSHKLSYNLLDPNDSNSVGLNPFVFDDPMQTAVAISTVLKGLYSSSSPDMTLAYRENAANQAVENLVILLKEMYPRLHEEDLPTLEDLQDCLTNFNVVENLCEQMKADEELSKKYSSLISYFERNFYKNAPNKSDMEGFVTHATSQLDSLLRYNGIKNILCNRTNSINFDNVLNKNEVTLICTRRGDLGQSIHTAFGLFCILMMQYSVLRRPGTESTRVPHFLYIDEFADFVSNSTDALFTLYRKYKISTIISVQNLAQLDGNNNKHRSTIVSNCSNKFVFGNNSPEDNEWWSKEIGDHKEWDFTNSYDTSKGEYDPKLGGIKYRNKIKYAPGKIQSLKFKQSFFKLRNLSGKSDIGIVNLNFLPATYFEEKLDKIYQFDKFNSGSSSSANNDNNDLNKFRKRSKSDSLKNYHFSDEEDLEVDPIKTDSANSNYLFDNSDAIVFNLKNKKDEN